MMEAIVRAKVANLSIVIAINKVGNLDGHGQGHVVIIHEEILNNTIYKKNLKNTIHKEILCVSHKISKVVTRVSGRFG